MFRLIRHAQPANTLAHAHHLHLPTQHRLFSTPARKQQHMAMPALTSEFLFPPGISQRSIETFKTTFVENKFHQPHPLYAVFDPAEPSEPIEAYCQEILRCKAMLLTLRRQIETQGGQFHFLTTTAGSTFKFSCAATDIWGRDIYASRYLVHLADVRIQKQSVDLDHFINHLDAAERRKNSHQITPNPRHP
jgi:hypothetical protein